MDNRRKIEDAEGFNEAWKAFNVFLHRHGFSFAHKCIILQVIDKFYASADETAYEKSLELRKALNSCGYFDNEDGCYKKVDERTEDKPKGQIKTL